MTQKQNQVRGPSMALTVVAGLLLAAMLIFGLNAVSDPPFLPPDAPFLDAMDQIGEALDSEPLRETSAFLRELYELLTPQPPPLLPPAEGEVRVHIIDVGQGDSILIQGPDANVLIDCGENGKGPDVLSYLEQQGVQQIDLLIGTHAHSDHIGGMDTVLHALPVQRVLMPELPDSLVPTTRTYLDVLDAIEENGSQMVAPTPGTTFDLGGGAILTLLGPVEEPEDLNNSSIICRLDHGSCSFLFTGDGEIEEEESLIRAGASLKADVLKAGHHGSSTSSSAAFLQRVQPLASAASLGEGNSYGHPHKEAVERLMAYGPLYRTDLLGSLAFTSDGTGILLTPEKGEPVVIK